jgi:hypothetical protein
MNETLRKTRLFNRVCGGLALLWLLAVPPCSLLRRPNLIDFPQFYMGGAVVRAGASASLYPIPHADSRHNPGLPGDSEMRPTYAALAERLGVGNGMRFIQPPPVALLLTPLSLLPYRTAGWIWVLVLGLAAWGAALYAARLFVLASGSRSRWEGILVLGIACSPRALATIRWGNVSTFVAMLLGILTCQILSGRSVRGGATLLVGGVVKYTPAVLLPLVVAARRWRLLAWSAIFGLALLVLSLAVMGTAPHLTFLREILPVLGRPYFGPDNQSLYAALARWTRQDPLSTGLSAAVTLARWLILPGIVFLMMRRPAPDWRRPEPVFAAAGALVAWFLIFCPVFWPSYQVYLWPFWGWLLAEGLRSPRRGLIAFLVIALGWLPWPSLYRMILRAGAPEPFSSSTLWSAVGLLAMAAWRLACPSEEGAHNANPAP